METTAAATQFPAKLRFLFQTVMPDGVTPIRYKVAWGGRYGTKTWGFARALLMLGVAQHERVLCTREYQKSIDNSVYRVLTDQITKLGMNYLFEVQQNSILGPMRPNRQGEQRQTEFIFEGLHSNIEKIKSYEGLTKCWVAEGNKTLKSSWNILIPTIREEGSEIWVEFNPELESDETYQRFILKPPSNAFVQRVSWRDNPWLSDTMLREIEDLKASDPDEYLWVYEGHCKQILAGAVYAEELRAARAGGRIMASVPYEPTRPVDVWFDLGWGDETTVWFGQAVAFEYRLIDYYHNRQKPIGHYFEMMQAKRTREGQRYLYGTIWLPHDARNVQLGTGKSIYEQACGVFGQGNVRLVTKMRLEEGINAARTIFPQCYFDGERCADGIQALSHYRYEIVEDNNKETLSRKPVHDWSSHGADAFRYFASSARSPRGKRPLRAQLEEAQSRVMNEGISQHGRPSMGNKRLGWMGR